MTLTQWQEKYLLQKEIEIFLEEEFVFAVNYFVRGYHISKSFWMLQSVQFYQPNMKITCNLWFTTSMLLH